MDKWLIKKPRPPAEKSPQKSKAPGKKQICIEQLSRVVVIEEIKQAAAILSMNDQKVDLIMKTLKDLQSNLPTKKIMVETGIEQVVKSLQTHSDEHVSKLARELSSKWENFYKRIDERKPIEVRCDAKTELFRKKARRLLSSSLAKDHSDPLAENIERYVYLRNNRKTSPSYRRLIRTITMKLQNNESLRTKVLSVEMTPEEICKEVLKC